MPLPIANVISGLPLSESEILPAAGMEPMMTELRIKSLNAKLFNQDFQIGRLKGKLQWTMDSHDIC